MRVNNKANFIKNYVKLKIYNINKQYIYINKQSLNDETSQ
jgi:hypothetical protein